jgi:hypothetical protein
MATSTSSPKQLDVLEVLDSLKQTDPVTRFLVASSIIQPSSTGGISTQTLKGLHDLGLLPGQKSPDEVKKATPPTPKYNEGSKTQMKEFEDVMGAGAAERRRIEQEKIKQELFRRHMRSQAPAPAPTAGFPPVLLALLNSKQV